MGARGPARKPVEQRRQTSRSSKRDNAGREFPDRADIVMLPGCGDEPPPLPSSIPGDGPGAKRWRETWLAGKSWISPQTDYYLVVRLCEAEDMRAAMYADLAREGTTIEGSKGQPVPNRLIDKLLSLDAQMTRYEGLLGLNPSARGTLGVAEVGDKPKSALEKLMEDRQRKRSAGS